jgi:hypothetical protein
MPDSLALVRSSCASLLSSCDGIVSIDFVAAASFGASLPALIAGDTSLATEGIDFPLMLDSADEIVDLTIFAALTAFGSGFRAPLHAATGAGASDTMIRGVLRFYLEGKKPSAAVLAHARVADVAETFGIPLSVDKPVGDHLPGVTISVAGPLRPLAEAIQHTFATTGAVLLAAGVSTFSALLRARAAEWHDAITGAPCAAQLVTVLATSFPAFRDEAVLANGDRIYFYKKAQLAVRELSRKFPNDPFWCLSSAEIATLTAFADNVIPTVLRQAGVLVYSEALATRVDNGEQLSAKEGADAPLRAGAVVAVDAIALAAGGLTAASVESVLWKLGKTKEYKDAPRHTTQDTIYY